MNVNRRTDAFYTLRVEGVLDGDGVEWFDGMTLTFDEMCGETTLAGYVADQAALHGLLNRFRDLNLGLIAVSRGEASGDTSGNVILAKATGGEMERYDLPTVKGYIKSS
jgi:hypothetical protein